MIGTLREIRAYFTAGESRQWRVLLAIALAGGLAQCLILAAFNDAVAAYGKGQSVAGHIPVLLVLCGISLAAGYLGAVRGKAIADRMAIRLRDQLLDRLGAANLRVVERVGPPGLHYHIMTSVGRLASAYGSLLGFATSLVMLSCNLLYLGWLSPLGLAAALVVTAVGVAVHFRQEARNLPGRLRLDALDSAVHARHQEAIYGYKELRLSAARTEDFRRRLEEENARARDQGLQVTRISTLGDLASQLFQFLLVFLLVFALPRLAPLDAVVILQMMGAVFVTMGPLSGVVGGIPGFANARVALEAMRMLQREVLDTREPVEAAASRPLPVLQSIELRGLRFDFGAAANGDAFRLGPIDLQLRRGEVLFVVGGNGSGKTVLMRVLTGLYRHTGGTILHNGVPLGDDARQAYRELFATVFSDFYLFRNLLGRPDADARTIERWLERLDLAGKTSVAGGVFDTVALSAGQRKRLAFLVAMLEERPVLVLDEFGAEQDPEHRRRFYRELLPELKARGTTVVVVSHDDAYYDAADRIVRMDYGRIVADSSAASGIAANRKAS